MFVKLNVIAFVIAISVFVLLSNAEEHEADPYSRSSIVCNSTSSKPDQCVLYCNYDPDETIAPACDFKANNFAQCFTLLVDDKVHRRCYDENDELVEIYCLTVGINNKCSTCENDEKKSFFASCISKIFFKHRTWSRDRVREGLEPGKLYYTAGIYGRWFDEGPGFVFICILGLIPVAICFGCIFCCYYKMCRKSGGVVIRKPEQAPNQALIQTNAA